MHIRLNMAKNNLRWLMLVLAFIGVFICYMDRAALSYAIIPIEHDFHLDNSQFGMLLSAFGFGYLVMVPIAGVLVDKVGSRKIWSIGALLWSIATTMIGLCSVFSILITLRFLVGVFESPSLPSLTRVSTNWLSFSERNRALAFGLAAVPLSAVIGAPLSTHLIANYGWRTMFLFLGAIGILWAICWFILYRNLPADSNMISSQELQYLENEKKLSPKNMHVDNITSWKFILLNKTFLINNYAFFSFGYLLFFGVTWLPGYLQQSFHMDIKTVGWFLVIPWLMAAIFIISTGYMCDWIWSKTKSLKKSRANLMGIMVILSALCFIPAIMTNNIHIAMIFMSLALAIGLAPNNCYYAINADLAPDKVGTSLGVMIMFFSCAGILAPLVTGFLSRATGNFKSAIAVMLFLNISTGILVLLFQNPDKELIKKYAVK